MYATIVVFVSKSFRKEASYRTGFWTPQAVMLNARTAASSNTAYLFMKCDLHKQFNLISFLIFHQLPQAGKK